MYALCIIQYAEKHTHIDKKNTEKERGGGERDLEHMRETNTEKLARGALNNCAPGNFIVCAEVR